LVTFRASGYVHPGPFSFACHHPKACYRDPKPACRPGGNQVVKGELVPRFGCGSGHWMGH